MQRLHLGLNVLSHVEHGVEHTHTHTHAEEEKEKEAKPTATRTLLRHRLLTAD